MANLQSPMTLFKFTEVAINKKNPDQTHNATEGGGVLDASCAQYQSWWECWLRWNVFWVAAMWLWPVPVPVSPTPPQWLLWLCLLIILWLIPLCRR